MIQLKGHRIVGGMRASIYYAMPIEGEKALVGYRREFEKQHGGHRRRDKVARTANATMAR